MEGNVFSSVCLSVILSTEEGGSHVTITHGALDLTIQGPTGPCPDPHPTEGPPIPDLTVHRSASLETFKLVHFETRTVSKWAFGITGMFSCGLVNLVLNIQIT